jgi:hypothetical protein
METWNGVLRLLAHSPQIRPRMSCRSSRLPQRRGLGSLNNRKNSGARVSFQLGKFLLSRCGECFILGGEAGWRPKRLARSFDAEPNLLVAWSDAAQSIHSARWGARDFNFPTVKLLWLEHACRGPLRELTFQRYIFLPPFCPSALGESLAENCPQSAELCVIPGTLASRGRQHPMPLSRLPSVK